MLGNFAGEGSVTSKRGVDSRRRDPESLSSLRFVQCIGVSFHRDGGLQSEILISGSWIPILRFCAASRGSC